MTIVFKDISECLTLDRAFQKEGRKIEEADLSIISNAALVVKDGKILWTGPFKKLPKEFKKSKKVSLKNKVVMPGFVECHTHAVFAGNRSAEFEMKFQGKSYAEIANAGGGILSTVQATRKASESELAQSFKTRALGFLKQGVTTLEVKSGYALNLKDELKLLRAAKKCSVLRVVTTYMGAHAKSPDYKDVDSYFDSVFKDLESVKKSKLTNRVDIFIEKNFFTVDQARKYFSKAKELGFQVVSHTNQLNPSEGVKVSVESGALSCDHLNYLEPSDIELLSKSHATCVFIPTADFYIHIPYPPARALLDRGARVALSTDFNPGTSPTQDLGFVGLLARLEMKMTLAEVISAWTVSSSFALGLQNDVGSLSVGKYADFVVLKDSWKDLFYQVGQNHVEQVYRSGKNVRFL